MKSVSKYFIVCFFLLLTSSCKSNKMAYEFPSDSKKKGLRGISDKYSAKWNRTRLRWAEREEEKFNQMFERMKGSR